jgi:hypothetical protein
MRKMWFASQPTCCWRHQTHAQTCTAQIDWPRYPGVTVTGAATPIWYVTAEVRKSGMLLKQRSPRETKTFATEAEAKIFARSKLDDGLAVFAGTINPFSPKRLILSSQILAWLAEEPADNEPPHGGHQE